MLARIFPLTKLVCITKLKTREKHTAAINVMFWSRALYAIYLRVGSKWA